jgi:hypothetical protein
VTLLVDAYFFILKVLVFFTIGKMPLLNVIDQDDIFISLIFFTIGKMPLLNVIDQDDIFISLILDVQMDNHSTNLPVCRFQKTRAIC